MGSPIDEPPAVESPQTTGHRAGEKRSRGIANFDRAKLPASLAVLQHSPAPLRLRRMISIDTEVPVL
jgi:hypothetical protein